MKIKVLGSILSITLVVASASGCSPAKSKYPASVTPDVKSCALISKLSSEISDTEYLGSLEKKADLVGKIKRQQQEFSLMTGVIAETQNEIFYWQLESLTASHYTSKVPGSAEDAGEILAKIKYSTDGPGVYKIYASEKATNKKYEVQAACNNLGRLYPPEKYEY